MIELTYHIRGEPPGTAPPVNTAIHMIQIYFSERNSI